MAGTASDEGMKVRVGNMGIQYIHMYILLRI